jgi:hypothetical protein
MGGTKTPLERIGTFPDGAPVHRAVDDGFYGHCRVIGGGTDVITPEILRTLHQMEVKGIKRMELSLEEYMAGAVTLTKAVIDVREENPLETAFMETKARLIRVTEHKPSPCEGLPLRYTASECNEMAREELARIKAGAVCDERN